MNGDTFLSSGESPCALAFLHQGKEDRLPRDLLCFQSSRPHESQRERPGFYGSRVPSCANSSGISHPPQGSVQRQNLKRIQLETQLRRKGCFAYTWPFQFLMGVISVPILTISSIFPLHSSATLSPLLMVFCSEFEGFSSFYSGSKSTF